VWGMSLRRSTVARASGARACAQGIHLRREGAGVEAEGDQQPAGAGEFTKRADEGPGRSEKLGGVSTSTIR
jgi:hypothetical protein